MSVTIELFGVPRLRAGAGRFTVDAATVGDALTALTHSAPALAELVTAGGALHSAYRLCLNTDRFIADPATPLADGDTLLLLAADAGG
jgi:molybdopterin converting factor small subunit